MKKKFPTFKIPNIMRNFTLRPYIEETILKQTKKEKNIIFGAQSIKAQIGSLTARPTKDFDIFAKKPKISAINTEKNLDKLWGSNYFYTKPALHPGTWKVMSIGNDNRKGTKDDEGIVDYSGIPKPRPRVVNIRGIRYRKLSSEKRAKYKALRDKESEFRHKKDREDVNRIKFATGKLR